jgi:hypothetical protein
MSSYSIQELMTCKYEGCNKIFKNPIELECNNTICKEHIEKILNESETKNMNCKLCNKNHTILIYHANTTMEKLLKMNAHLNNEQKLFHNEFKTCIKEMDIAYIKVKSLLDKPRDYLINQINLIKTNIELQNNKFINYSNKISTEYLRILDSFQKECEVKLKERVCVHTVEKDICYEDYEEAYEDSIRIKFDKEIMKETIDRIKKSTENYNEQFKRLTMLVFMNKKIKFEPKKIDNDLFGKLEIKIDKVKEETYMTNCKVESELEDIYDSCESSLSHSIENKNESLSTDSESKISI